ncbi:hypothetical protein ACIGHN_27940 [Acidovorax sp. NPDC077693]|uniref:hypothetical protein n=1 Tax=unclassified Acidovorax TaxID=2684926 RepID=UPI0037CBF4F0
MKTAKASALQLTALLIGLSAVTAQANDETAQCQSAGDMVMHAWHRLDACQASKHLDTQSVQQAKNKIRMTYPRLAKAIAQTTRQSQSAKAIANGLPLDVQAPENAELLSRMCTTSRDEADLYADTQWRQVLHCWR